MTPGKQTGAVAINQHPIGHSTTASEAASRVKGLGIENVARSLCKGDCQQLSRHFSIALNGTSRQSISLRHAAY